MVSTRKIALFAVAALAVSSCGGSEVTSTRDSDTGADTTIAETTDSAQPSTSDGTATESTTSESDWAGEPFDLFAEDGDVFSVVGVAFDDVLNVRSGPAATYNILTKIDPQGTAVATGREWEFGGFWYEVTADGKTGWVASSFLAYSGITEDITAEILTSPDAFNAKTLLKMGELVAATQASEDIESKITQVSAPNIGATSDVIYDVIGLADDSAAGYRLHIFAEDSPDGDFFVLSRVKRTTLCTRGLNGQACT